MGCVERDQGGVLPRKRTDGQSRPPPEQRMVEPEGRPEGREAEGSQDGGGAGGRNWRAGLLESKADLE